MDFLYNQHFDAYVHDPSLSIHSFQKLLQSTHHGPGIGINTGYFGPSCRGPIYLVEEIGHV